MSSLVDVRAEDYDEEAQGACEAMLLFWYAEVGGAVEADQDLAEIETAKAVVVVKAPASGRLREILVREGDAVRPGQRLAVIECSETSSVGGTG